MQKFSYRAKSFSGEIKTGVIEAESQSEVAKLLRQDGYILIFTNPLFVKTKTNSFSMNIFDRISLTDKIMFCRNLQVMAKAGIPFSRSLKILVQQAKSKRFQKVLSEISDEITRGSNLSDCLKKYPDIFSDLFSSMVKVGEESGTLEKSLLVLVKQMEKEHEIKSKVKSALAYPLVILTAMGAVGVLMFIFVVPKISSAFTNMGVELPLVLKIITAIGVFAINFWYLIPVFAFIIYMFFYFLVRSRTVKSFTSQLLLKTPIANSIIKKTNSAYAIRTLSSLMAAGIPIVRSLELVSITSGNVSYKRALEEIAEDVKKGSKIASAFSKHNNIFSSLITQMVEVGEETGETASMLENLAEFYEEEVSNVTKSLSTIIEPALMIVIGIAVGFFAISIIQSINGAMISL